MLRLPSHSLPFPSNTPTEPLRPSSAALLSDISFEPPSEPVISYSIRPSWSFSYTPLQDPGGQGGVIFDSRFPRTGPPAVSVDGC